MTHRRASTPTDPTGPDHGPGHRDLSASELRRGHNTGAFGDKVAAPDPAMSPLGTDDEAAGTAPTAGPPPPGPSTPGETFAGTGDGTGRPALYAAIAVTLVVAVIVAVLLLSN